MTTLNKDTIGQYRGSLGDEAASKRAYEEDEGYRAYYDTFLDRTNDLDSFTRQRLPTLLLNRHYTGKWEQDDVDSQTAALSQGVAPPASEQIVEDRRFNMEGIIDKTLGAAKGLGQFFTDPLVLASQLGYMGTTHLVDALLPGQPGKPARESLKQLPEEYQVGKVASRVYESGPSILGMAALATPAAPFAPLIAGGARFGKEQFLDPALIGESAELNQSIISGLQEAIMFKILGGGKGKITRKVFPGIKSPLTGAMATMENHMAQSILSEEDDDMAVGDWMEGLAASGLIGYGIGSLGKQRIQGIRGKLGLDGGPPGGGGGGGGPDGGGPRSNSAIVLRQVYDNWQKSREQKTRLKMKTPQYQEAVTLGVEEPTVKLIAEANTPTKSAMRTVVDLLEAGKENLLEGNRQKEFVGGFIADRGASILESKQRIGKEKGAIVKKHENTPVELTKTSETIARFLNDYRIRTIHDTKRRIIGVKGERLSSADADYIMDVIRRTRYGTQTPRRLFADADGTRGWMFDEMLTSRQRQKPITDNPVMFAFSEGVRNAILRDMEPVSPEYVSKSAQYQELSTALEGFLQIMQVKKSAKEVVEQDLRAGEVRMRVFGNASAKPLDIYNTLDAVAKKYGYRSSVDIPRLFRFLDLAESFYPITQTRGFAGGVATGGGNISILAGRGPVTGMGTVLGRAGLKKAHLATERAVIDAKLYAIKKLLYLKNDSPEMIEALGNVIREELQGSQTGEQRLLEPLPKVLPPKGGK